jgi:hypothetical protein
MGWTSTSVDITMAFVLTILIASFVMGLLFLHARNRMLVKLAEHDKMICPCCHYPFAGLIGHDRCPECGTDSNPKTVAALWDRWMTS